MKSAILWILAIAFCVIGAQAVNMHEYVIALVCGGLAVALVWATPNGKSGKKSRSRSHS